MKRNCLIVIFLFFCTSLFAQREYNVCDSTFYVLNNDTTIIAGTKNLYVHTNASVIPLHDFTSADTNEYIRDFDIVKPDLWYTIVGSRYIGGLTNLYKSTDHGQTWSIDTAHFAASNASSVSYNFLRSINNLQQLNGDTLIMFMHYYESGIIYSTDAGITWTKWFDNLIAHYQGMLSCNDKYYIYSFEGDAFRPWMFGFDKNLLFSPDTNGAWNSFMNTSNHPQCSTTNDTVNCVYSPSSNSRCDQYNHFKNYIDSICMSTDIPFFTNESFSIYPNPASDFLTIKTPFTGQANVSIFNVLGRKMTSDRKFEKELGVEIQNYPIGMYILHFNFRGRMYWRKFIRE